MLRLTGSLLWSATYFRNVKPPQQRRRPGRAADTAPTPEPQATTSSPARKSFKQPPSVVRNLSSAHQSALNLVTRALSSLHGDQAEHARLSFEVKSEIIPCLKLVLPDPIPRPGIEGLSDPMAPPTNSSQSGRYVAVPTARLPQLSGAADDSVAAFLKQSEELRQPNHGKDFDTYNFDDVADMLQLAYKFEVKDVDLTLRLYGVLERLLERSRVQGGRDEVDDTTAPLQEEKKNSHKAVIMSAAAVSRILFFTSSLGFLEQHILKELVNRHLAARVKRRQLSTRQLIHTAVAMLRFDLTVDPVFDQLMRLVSARCSGTRLVEDRKQVSSTSGLPLLKANVVRESSIAHPTQALSAEMLVEFTSCVALSVHRDPCVVDAITIRLLQLCDGSNATTTTTQQSPPPTTEQLHFVCRLLRATDCMSEPLEAALLSRASISGVIINHGGDTQREEAGFYSYITADLIKST